MSGPRQPQCLCSVKERTPWISCEGLVRVKVVQRKLFSVAAANEALRKAREAVEREMKKVTGGVGLPGMF